MSLLFSLYNSKLYGRFSPIIVSVFVVFNRFSYKRLHIMFGTRISCCLYLFKIVIVCKGNLTHGYECNFWPFASKFVQCSNAVIGLWCNICSLFITMRFFAKLFMRFCLYSNGICVHFRCNWFLLLGNNRVTNRILRCFRHNQTQIKYLNAMQPKKTSKIRIRCIRNHTAKRPHRKSAELSDNVSTYGSVWTIDRAYCVHVHTHTQWKSFSSCLNFIAIETSSFYPFSSFLTKFIARMSKNGIAEISFCLRLRLCQYLFYTFVCRP